MSTGQEHFNEHMRQYTQKVGVSTVTLELPLSFAMTLAESILDCKDKNHEMLMQYIVEELLDKIQKEQES